MLKHKRSIYMYLCALTLTVGVIGATGAEAADSTSTAAHKSIVPDLPPMDPIAPGTGNDSAPASGAGDKSDATGKSDAAGGVTVAPDLVSPPPTDVAPPLPVDKPAVNSLQTNVAPSNKPAAPGGGPFLQKRLQLKEKVAAAQKQGIGISAYQAEIGRIEEAAQKNPSGDDLEALEKRIDNLRSGIDEQLVRSQNLKLQRPSLAGTSTPSSASGGPPAHGGDSTERLMNALRQRFGNNLPSNLPSSLDPATRDRLLNSDAARDLLKRLRSGN